jgi:hypothetical protein
MGDRCKILVFPARVKVSPPRPEVVAGYEELQLRVVWDRGEERWLSVTVCDFRNAHGRVETQPSRRSYLFSAGNATGVFDFVKPVDAEEDVTYDIVYQGLRPGMSFNAVVRLKPFAQRPDVSKSMKSESAR